VSKLEFILSFGLSFVEKILHISQKLLTFVPTLIETMQKTENQGKTILV